MSLVIIDEDVAVSVHQGMLGSVLWYGSDINNDSRFRLKHPGVLDGSDGSDRTCYPLTENYTLLVAQATGRVAHSPPLLRAWYTHNQNNRCVTLFAGAAVML